MRALHQGAFHALAAWNDTVLIHKRSLSHAGGCFRISESCILHRCVHVVHSPQGCATGLSRPLRDQEQDERRPLRQEQRVRRGFSIACFQGREQSACDHQPIEDLLDSDWKYGINSFRRPPRLCAFGPLVRAAPLGARTGAPWNPRGSFSYTCCTPLPEKLPPCADPQRKPTSHEWCHGESEPCADPRRVHRRKARERM